MNEPTTIARVPFVDLGRTHAALKAKILDDVAAVMDMGAFVDGSDVGDFESAFARYCSSKHAIGVASGLDALRLCLIAGGLEPGDEVIVPANTFIATAEAVTQAKGTPVFVDVSELDYNLDTAAVAAAITQRTRFLLPVHLYGQLADMTSLRAIAVAQGQDIVEDACQAHGATRDGNRAGASGLAGAFSFYPTKNLGAMGDAGAATTNDDGLAETVRALRQHGQRDKYVHELEGYTARLDTIQALVLRHKLPLLEKWNDQRRGAAALYLEALDGVGDLQLPPVAPGSSPVWHLFVLRTADPTGLAEFMRLRGIQTGRHYPTALHLTPAYEDLGYTLGMFPVAEALAHECLSIPIFPGIHESEITQVVATIKGYFEHA